MGTSVISEMGTLIKDHPYISCSLLIFLTPPVFPILKFFSPLLISTALFIVALVTMGPHFEGPSDQEGQLQTSSEIDAAGEAYDRAADGRRNALTKNTSKGNHFSPSGWIKSCKESGIAWMEQKLFRNDNWRASSLNDENVSILQEAFAHRVEEKPHMMVKLITRRIPAEEERVPEEHSFRRQGVPDLLNSGSWKSSYSPDRGSERPDFFSVGMNTRDLPYDIFSPHPSFSRRQDSDTPLFENVEPPPIEFDMPPLVTGPASVSAPRFRSFEDDIDSDDEYDHHHSDHDEHMHLEVGERLLAADSLSQDELPVTNGICGQPPPFTVKEEDLPPSSESDEERRYLTDWLQGAKATESSLSTMHDEVHNRDTDLHEQKPAGALESYEISAPHSKDAFEERFPSADILDGERPIPAQKIHQESHPLPTSRHKESLVLNKDLEVHDIPELEDDLLVENEIPVSAGESSTWREFVAESNSGDRFGTDVQSDDVPASHMPEVPTDHATTSKELQNEQVAPVSPKDFSVEPHHSIDRSMSLPVMGSLAAADSADLATAHEDLTQSDKSVPDDVQEPAHQSYALSSAISLPVGRNSIQPMSIPPKSANQRPLSPDTDLGYATSPDHERLGAACFFPAERFNFITSFSGDESELPLPAKQLSTKEKLSNIEALCNSMPSASGETRCLPADQVAILRATTDEQVTHVTGKLKDFMDSSSKKFQPDAPQLQITPPSTKIVLNAPPSKSAVLASAPGRPSLWPVVSSTRTYGGARFSSNEESSEDEQIDLDSDIEAVGTDSDSDFEIVEPTGKSRIKAPPKPPEKIREP